MKPQQLCGAAAGAPSAPRGEHSRGRGAAAAGRGRLRAVSRAAARDTRRGVDGESEEVGVLVRRGAARGSAARPSSAFPPAQPRRSALLRSPAAGTSALQPPRLPWRSLPFLLRAPTLSAPRLRAFPSGRGSQNLSLTPAVPPPLQSLLLHHFRTMKHPAPAGCGRGSGRRCYRSCRPPATGPRAGLGCAGPGKGASGAPRCPLPPNGPPATEIPLGG